MSFTPNFLQPCTTIVLLRISSFGNSAPVAYVDMEPDGTRREYFVVAAFRKRLKKEGSTLDFGCCTFPFDLLPD